MENKTNTQIKERPRYQRKQRYTYTYAGNNVISVDLNNGYTVYAISKYDKQEECYYFTLYLTENTNDTLVLIEQKEKVKISDVYNVKDVIFKLNDEHFFDYYIKRYEYMLKCFEKGNDFYEEQGIVDKDFNFI